MAKKKVIAYYLSEAEKDLILSYLQSTKQTDSFIIGELERRDEENLLEHGVILNDLGTHPQGLPDDFKIIGNQNLYKKSTDFSIEYGFPQDTYSSSGFYKLTITGPLLDEYQQTLNELRIQVLEFYPPNFYIVKIENRETFNLLDDLDFVEQISRFTGNDTPLNIFERSFLFSEKAPVAMEVKMLSFDILLHNEADQERFKKFLNDNHVDIAGSSGRKVRIYLLDSDDLKKVAIMDHDAVREVFEYVPPKLHNDYARSIVGLSPAPSAIAPLPSAFPYQGSGQIIGIADTGIDVGHPDFNGRISGVKDFGGRGGKTDPDGHGTHVAGTVLGDGTASSGQYRGAAPAAKLYFQSLLNPLDKLAMPFNLKDLFKEAYDNDVRVHNNSWGSSTYSKINAQALEVDEFVWENKDMLLVFSAGNDGKSSHSINVPSGHVDFLSIGSPGTAKNILTVGSSRSSRKKWGYSNYTYNFIWTASFPDPPYTVETISGNPDCLAAFSSRGPSDDSRIKPDIVAPGTDIVSSKSAQSSPSNFWAMHPTNNQYSIMGGTSMAAPLISGIAALVREYYEKVHTYSPSAALLKATIINGTKKLTGVDATIVHSGTPNFNQGFGMVNLTTTIPTPDQNFFLHFTDNYLQPDKHLKVSGQKFTLNIKLNSPGWIRVCLAYTDFPARALQNNLNLIINRKKTSQKWIGNENAHALLKSLDTINNVETIIIENAEPDTYTITVVASNIIKGPQDFALVVSSSDTSINIV